VGEIEIETPHGPARAHLEMPDDVRGLIALGHGAGGGVGAPDLVRAGREARAVGFATALVEQPYRVAGRKAPPPIEKACEAWVAVLAELRDRHGAGQLVVGGRSFGARVACRTAAESGAAAVLCLAFPEHPPGKPEKTRQAELDAVAVPVLVVQGESDPFGMPKGGPGKEIVTVAGNHSLKKDLDAVGAAVAGWLSKL
jgi:predicted alpha/beta-hydrolase family hydrolase